MPLGAEKMVDGEALIRIGKKADETKESTHLTQELDNLKATSMDLRNFQLILSKSLDMLNFKSIPEMWEVLREWIASLFVMMPLRICLPSTYEGLVVGWVSSSWI